MKFADTEEYIVRGGRDKFKNLAKAMQVQYSSSGTHTDDGGWWSSKGRGWGRKGEIYVCRCGCVIRAGGRGEQGGGAVVGVGGWLLLLTASSSRKQQQPSGTGVCEKTVAGMDVVDVQAGSRDR